MIGHFGGQRTLETGKMVFPDKRLFRYGIAQEIFADPLQGGSVESALKQVEVPDLKTSDAFDAQIANRIQQGIGPAVGQTGFLSDFDIMDRFFLFRSAIGRSWMKRIG
jgi:hypothetical protein